MRIRLFELRNRHGERPLMASLLAPTLSPGRRFVLNELRRTGRVADYRLRGSRARVVIRHRGPDLVTYAEIFGHRDYEFPAEVRELVRSAGRPVRVLDMGANSGLFSAFAIRELPAPLQIVAYEPDPEHFAVLARCAELNRVLASWQLHEALATTEDGLRPFISGRGPGSHAADDPSEPGAISVSARDVFGDLLSADIVKLDIEGGEWELLADARLQELQAFGVVLEYHPEHAPGEPRKVAEQSLRRSGFEVRHGRSRAGGYGILWGIRARRGQV